MYQSTLIKLKNIVGKILKTRQERRHALVGAGKLWKMKQRFQIDFLMNMGLKKSDKLLDIGCGTLRGGIPIISFLDRQNYFGLEVRKSVLEEGKKELRSAKLEYKLPNLMSFDCFEDIDLDIKFDIVFAFSVIIHLEDQIAERCFEFVGSHLKPDGVFYANVNIGDLPDGYWQGFPVVFRRIDFYKTLAEKNLMLLEQLGNLESLGHISGKLGSDQQIMLKMTKI